MTAGFLMGSQRTFWRLRATQRLLLRRKLRRYMKKIRNVGSDTMPINHINQIPQFDKGLKFLSIRTLKWIGRSFSRVRSFPFKKSKIQEEILIRITQAIVVLFSLFALFSCANEDKTPAISSGTPVVPIQVNANNSVNQPPLPPSDLPTSTPEATTTSPIGKFDFKNFTYPLRADGRIRMAKLRLKMARLNLS